MAGNSSRTRTDDPTYDLTSVLYHSLQGAETIGKYLADTEGSSDDELTNFFREVREQQMSHAERAKQLLARRLS